MQNTCCISNLNLSVKSLGLQQLYLWQTNLLPLKAFIRPLHKASMQTSSHAGADQMSSSSCGWQDDALLDHLRQVWSLMTQNSWASPAPQRPHSPWTSYLDLQRMVICCWSRQHSCSRHHSELPLNYFSIHGLQVQVVHAGLEKNSAGGMLLISFVQTACCECPNPMWGKVIARVLK